MKEKRSRGLYGENTKMISIRVPESKEAEIKAWIYEGMMKYEKRNILVPFDVEKAIAQKNSGKGFAKTDISEENIPLIGAAMREGNVYSEKSDPSDELKESKADIVTRLQAGVDSIKSGSQSVDFPLTKKKVDIDSVYEFDIVKSLPDLDSRVTVDIKLGIAMYDKYDHGIFYINWEGRYLKFTDELEFKRFIKDNNIK